MRWIAYYELIVGLLLVAVGVELFRLLGEDTMAAIHAWALEFHADPHRPWIARAVERVGAVEVRELRDLAWVSVFLGSVHGAEGVGLWFRRRWAEYLCILSTASLLPMEVHELIERPGPIRLAVLGVNLAILALRVARAMEGRGRASPIAVRS